MDKKQKNTRGFTFIELLLIMAMVLILSVPGAIFSTRLIHQSAVRNATEATKEMLQEAQAQAMSGKENSNWGVKLQDSKIVLFVGQSFLLRKASLDHIFEINENVSISGFDEIVFRSDVGTPVIENSNIKFSWGDVEESVTINSEGVIQ